MRSLSLPLLLVVAVGTVLVFSLRSLRQERERLRQAFVTGREADVRELASDLEDRLRELEEDGRIIETLVGRTYESSGVDRDEGTRTLRASFNALATVIRHYRTLVLLPLDGPEPLVVAVDPTEAPAIARALVELSSARGRGGAPGRHLAGPTELPGGRLFYFYRFPVGRNQVILSIDAPQFLQSALRSVPDSRLMVFDPSGVEWIRPGSGARLSIRSPAEAAERQTVGSGAAGATWLDEPVSRTLGLPAGSTLAVWASATPAGLGTWRVLLVRSARNMDARQRAAVRQVVLTATSLLIAIGVLGTLAARQQRYSAALAERLRSAEAVRSLERQLISAEKLATTGVLAAGIAHEVGTPLGIIRARAELLLDDLDRVESRRALEAIVEQIDRISSIIRQVLDFSRMQPVELGHVDVREALPQALDLLGHRLRQQRIATETDIPPDLPLLAADPSQLQQVLINVLLNACDACETGGSIRVVARPAAGRSRVRLEVHDTGMGIAPEHLLAVFDPFFTTKKRGEGTGLGLPIAASIVRNHGGEITLTSTPGEGTTVTIVWPAASEETDA
jgi:signal transduction histidine kinase